MRNHLLLAGIPFAPGSKQKIQPIDRGIRDACQMSYDNDAIVVVDAPSNLGLRPPAPGREPGVFRLPQALRAAGLVSRLQARDGGQLTPPAYQPARDPQTGIRNGRAIHDFSLTLAQRIQTLVEQGSFPLVLGGDCTVLIGAMLALRRRGRYGLLFLDGHTDFGTLQTSQTGGAAGMDLALVCGYGPDLLADIDGRKPLVQERDMVAFGFRDVQDPNTYVWKAIFQTQIRLMPLNVIRHEGVESAVAQAIAHFRRRQVAGVWIHLDADVLADEVMPAVDSRQPGGLTYAELELILSRLLSSSLAVGMEITIFDPDLDRDGRLAAEFTDALVRAFKQGARHR